MTCFTIYFLFLVVVLPCSSSSSLLDSVREKYGLAKGEMSSSSSVDAFSMQKILHGCQHENPDALYLLGLLKFYGQENLHNGANAIQKDTKGALHLFRQAAEKGHVDAQFSLGVLHFTGESDLPLNSNMAAAWLTASAQQGQTDAQWMLATMLNEGRGVARDPARALELLQESARKKNSYGMFHLGVMYEYGRGGAPQDLQKAAALYQEAAFGSRANGDALYYLGLMYLHGRGVELDSNKAMELFKKGADLNHAPCLHALGKLYSEGEATTSVDYSIALSYFKRAAALSDIRISPMSQNAVDEITLFLTRVEKYIKAHEERLGARFVELQIPAIE